MLVRAAARGRAVAAGRSYQQRASLVVRRSVPRAWANAQGGPWYARQLSSSTGEGDGEGAGQADGADDADGSAGQEDGQEVQASESQEEQVPAEEPPKRNPLDDIDIDNLDCKFVEAPKKPAFGQGRRFNRPRRDPETGLEDGGRLHISLDGKQKVNSGLVPLDMRDEIYRLHKQDPEGKGSLVRLAQITGLRVMKIQGIIKVREKELEIEEEQGYPLDQRVDQLARAYFGEKRSWRGEFDVDEKKARVSIANRGKFDWVLPNEQDPELKSFADSTSLGGFFKSWKVKKEYNGEKVLKDDGRYLFLKVKKTPKRRKPII